MMHERLKAARSGLRGALWQERPKAVDAGTGDVFVDLGCEDAGERKLRVQHRECRSTTCCTVTAASRRRGVGSWPSRSRIQSSSATTVPSHRAPCAPTTARSRRGDHSGEARKRAAGPRSRLEWLSAEPSKRCHYEGDAMAQTNERAFETLRRGGAAQQAAGSRHHAEWDVERALFPRRSSPSWRRRSPSSGREMRALHGDGLEKPARSTRWSRSWTSRARCTSCATASSSTARPSGSPTSSPRTA